MNQPTDTHFVYDPVDRDFTTYPSAEEAKAACEKAFTAYRIDAAEGWDEEVDGLCWGSLSERVRITKTYWSGEFDEMIERELLPVKGVTL